MANINPSHGRQCGEKDPAGSWQGPWEPDRGAMTYRAEGGPEAPGPVYNLAALRLQ